MRTVKRIVLVVLAASLVYVLGSCGKKLAPTALESSETQQARLLSGKTMVAWEVAPQPQGGFEAIMTKLVYPESARRARIEGRTILEVTIGTDGEIEAAEVVRSSGNPELDQAALAAVRAVGWKPAEANGAPVAATVHLPIVFRLNEESPGEMPSGLEGPPKAVQMGEESSFTPYDRPPEPVGGFAGLQKKLKLPESARGQKGRSILNVYVDASGHVAEVKILASAGHRDLDAAAKEALRSVEWKPAMRGGKPVGVWVAIPVIFK